MVSANEFSHVIKLSEIGNHSHNIRLSADEDARSGIIKRFDLAELDKLEAEISLTHEAAGVIAGGQGLPEQDPDPLIGTAPTSELSVEPYQRRNA